jgi:hypothetical protein
VLILFSLLSCGHHAPPESAAAPSPYGQCPGEYVLDLSGEDFSQEHFLRGSDVLVNYELKLEDEPHYVACLIDWQCEHGGTSLPLETPACIEASHCCDLGPVR